MCIIVQLTVRGQWDKVLVQNKYFLRQNICAVFQSMRMRAQFSVDVNGKKSPS